MTQFREIWRLKIKHDYYRNGDCRGLKYSLSQNSDMLLRKRGGRLIQAREAEWLLIAFSDDIFDDADQLELDFICEDLNLIYNTEWDWQADGTCPQIRVGANKDMRMDMRMDMRTPPDERVYAKPNIFFRMIVSLHGINYQRTSVTELFFTAKSFYWEYWLVPRDGNTDRNLELEIKDSNKEIECYRCEDSGNPMNIPLVKFRTSVRLKAQEEGSEKVSLYEILSSGVRKPLLRSLPLPILGKFPFNKEDKDSALTLAYF